MSDEEVKITIEEEDLKQAAPDADRDVVAELRSLGRQVGDTLRSAWESEERQKFESQVKEGFQSFVSEIDKAVHEIRETEAARKVKEEAGELRSKVNSAEITYKAGDVLSRGLRWLSEGLGTLAEQFTPREKEPEATAPVEKTPEES